MENYCCCIILIVHNKCVCLSFRAQRSEVETRNEVKSPEGKSGFRLGLLFIHSQISPLRAALRPYGRDDKGVDFNHNRYNRYSPPTEVSELIFRLCLVRHLWFKNITSTNNFKTPHPGTLSYVYGLVHKGHFVL